MTPQTDTKRFPRGGVHPKDDFKARTSGKSLARMAPPAQVAVLMAQHIGASATPVVQRGDKVKKGQLVGEARGFISANVHAPFSGVVKAVEPRIFSVTGALVEAVIIESDGEGAWAEGLNQPQRVESMDAAQMRSLVHECGVVGLGGATFPSHVKLSPPAGSPISDVIINGAECEPYVTVDHRLMLERTDQIIDGLKLIMRVVDCETGWVAIERNKPDAIEAFEQALRGEPNIRVAPLSVRYPQGAEQQLITAITGREVPSGGGLPADVACLVHNVATTLAIRDAIRLRRPLIERAVTITGDGIENAGNFIELIGTNVADLLERQGVRPGANQVILGGPMMGIAQGTVDLPLVKGNNAIIVRRDVEAPLPRACIRCGRCVEACPLGLLPAELSITCEAGDWEAARRLDILECKECGCCAYVCPARRRIVQLIKQGKVELRRQKKKLEKEK